MQTYIILQSNNSEHTGTWFYMGLMSFSSTPTPKLYGHHAPTPYYKAILYISKHFTQVVYGKVACVEQTYNMPPERASSGFSLLIYEDSSHWYGMKAMEVHGSKVQTILGNDLIPSHLDRTLLELVKSK